MHCLHNRQRSRTKRRFRKFGVTAQPIDLLGYCNAQPSRHDRFQGSRIMNAKELLTLLDEDFSDKNVAAAIAWLKTKKPNHRKANEIFLKVFFHPYSLKEKDWLKTSLDETDLEIFKYSLLELKNIEHLYLLLEFLRENFIRQDAGYLWAALLSEIRHKDIEPGALEWLRNAHTGTPAINSVLKELLRLNPDLTLVQKAKEILKREFDLFLLVPLIEYSGDDESYEAGAKVLSSDESPYLKMMVAHAMAQSDASRNLEHIQVFLADKKAQKQVSRLLLELSENSAELFEFVCEWISQNLNTAVAKYRIKRPIFILPSRGNALRLWNWFKRKEYSDARFEVMVRFFDNAWCPLNGEAETYVSEWLQQNPKHKLCKYAKSALNRTIENRFAYEHNPLKGAMDVLPADDGSINFEEFRNMVDFFDPGDAKDDEEIQQELRKWIEKSPQECETLTFQFNQFRKSKNPSDFHSLNFCLELQNLSFRQLLMNGVFQIDEGELTDIALEALNGPKLLRRWQDSVHRDKGTLLVQMLQIAPDNEQLYDHAERWLAIRPDKFEYKIFDELTKIVKRHEKYSA